MKYEPPNGRIDPERQEVVRCRRDATALAQLRYPQRWGHRPNNPFVFSSQVYQSPDRISSLASIAARRTEETRESCPTDRMSSIFSLSVR